MTTTLNSRLTFRGEWQPGAAYVRLDVVRYGGRKYECIRDVDGLLPPSRDADHWQAESTLLFLLGSALIWTPPQLDVLAATTAADYGSASRVWRGMVPPAWADVLTGNRWDNDRQTYGRVTASTLKTVSLAFAAAVAADLALEAEPMIAAEVAIEDWQLATAETVKLSHVAMAAFAVGGLKRLTAADLKTVSGEIRYSLRKLRRFARATENGDARAGSEEIVRARAKLYGARLNAIYEHIRQESHRRARSAGGLRLFLFERNLLDDSEHCSENDAPPLPGCLEEAGRGWQKIGTLSLPGTRACAMGCKCSMHYAITAPHGDN